MMRARAVSQPRPVACLRTARLRNCRPVSTITSRPSLIACKPVVQVQPQQQCNRSRARVVLSCASSNGTADFSPRTQASDDVLSLWRKAQAVCFDVDCTITVNDSLDLLADFMGCKEQVAALTNKAMDGSMNLEQALEERLKIINCTPTDIRNFIKAHPPSSRLAPGIERLITALKARGVTIYLISGGFRELTLPIAKHLGIPAENVFANRMNWQWDDELGEPTKLVGFDEAEPTAHNQGKPQAIARIRQKSPYKTIVMIGDGITDLEAVQVSGGADLFIGYGGVVERPAVAREAEWFVYDYDDLVAAMRRYTVAMVGSGAWACAAVRILAQNVGDTNDPADEFTDIVKMWVYEEDYNGKKLTEVINETHENPKYFPGINLGENVLAVPTLDEAVQDADILVFCAPHQFLRGLCKSMIGKIKPQAFAISLVKGMRVRSDGPQLISQMITKYLGIDCSVLMGANIATDIGREELSEAVIGYTNLEHARILQKIFNRDYFVVSLLPDVVGAEMCGTLKNIVALAAGFIDGLGLGPNSKAAIMRQGLTEMRKFSKALYPTVRDETFFESCGMADLIATCYGGRNRLVAFEFTKAWKSGERPSFESLESTLLKGQKLQGVLTSNEVQEILVARGWSLDYPLFTTVNRIVNGKLPPSAIVEYNHAAEWQQEGEAATDEFGIPLRPPATAAAAK